MVGQAAAVGVEVAHGETLRGLGVRQGKPGQQIVHAAVPFDPPQAHLACHHRGAQWLGKGRELEHRVAIHGTGVAQAAHAQALGGDGLATMHHGPG